MAVWYLDNDDEITDAVARLRGSSDEQVVFVVPPGSRIATGRINFKLLAREAETRAKEMAIASPDQQVRALATSAGVLAAATVEQAEAALARGDVPPEPVEAPESMVAAGDSATGRGATGSDEPGARSRPWDSRRLVVTTVMLVALLLVGAFAATQLLPTAQITLRPRVSTLGPIEVPVLAMPSITQPDNESGQIPAVTLPVPLVVRGTFSASGTEAIEANATGEVVFFTPDQPTEQEIPAGTRLKTPAGVEFETTETVTLPATEGDTSEVRAPVEAVRSGADGNVSAGAISVVPSLAEQGISVSNPEPTSGGRFEQTLKVTADDYDAAAVDLQNRLASALVAYLRDPANAPDGLTVFPSTAQLGIVRHEPTFDELVSTSGSEFELSAEVTASVLAVDPDLVDEVALARLQAAVPEDMDVLAGSVTSDPGDGTADGQRIRFAARAAAATYPRIDADELVQQVAGLPVSEARAILASFGSATVNVWPGFLDSLPADRGRIELDVTEPSTTE